MNKIDEKKQKKQEALFNTAFELFTTKGLQKTAISDIVQKAGVAKGTFYLYFKDKYDIRNKLVAHKASELLTDAHHALSKTKASSLEDKILFMVDHIVNSLTENKSLLNFIAKNLNWGVFLSVKDMSKTKDDSSNFYQLYLDLLKEDGRDWKHPELMLFTIMELVSGTCYNTILHDDPLPIEQFKPYLYYTIQLILEGGLKEVPQIKK